ncbi:MAG: flagellar hook-associated protein FlgL [bacterium]
MVRITQNLLSDRTLLHLQTNLFQIQQLQERLSTGRSINRPSDNPLDFPIDLDLRANIMAGRRFVSNVEFANTDLELTETTLASVTDVLQKARDLAVQGATDFSPEARIAVAYEIGEILGQVIDLSNTNFHGKYLFGGSETQTKPFESVDGTIRYVGDDATRETIIGTRSRIGMNLNGTETFLHTANQITAQIGVLDKDAPLAAQLALVVPNFPNVPPLPDSPTTAQTSPSPNPANFPGRSPDNFATFTIYDTEIHVDLSQDSLQDVADRINATSSDVIASIDSDNRLVIASRRADALDLSDGPSNPGFPPEPTFGLNLLSALGIHRRIEFNRNLDSGYPATDPLGGPPGVTSFITVEPESLLFASSNTGAPQNPSVPFPDNLAIRDLNDNVLNELESIRVTIDDEVIDIDLRALTTGSIGPDAVAGTQDDVQGSNMQDLLALINNDPRLAGKALAYINREGTGIGITATTDTDVFKVENIRKVFGRDLTTRLTTDGLGIRSITRIEPITEATKITDLAGALTDGTDSLGVRLPQFLNPVPPSTEPVPVDVQNQGLVTVINGDRRVSINLGHVITVGDVLRAFNESGAGVKATVNDSGTGISVESVLPSSGQLQILDVDLSTMASDLGLVSSPPPRSIDLNLAAIPAAPTDQVNTLGVVDGTFQFTVCDGPGRELGSYTVSIAATDTIRDVVKKIDALDGFQGPSNGLFSASVINNRVVLTSNYDGHVFHIDRANDTTGFVAAIGLDQSTFLTETEVTTLGLSPASSNQDTASIIGLNGDGRIEEVVEKNVFRTLQNLHLALLSDDTDGIEQALSDIDIDLDILLNDRTVIGARINRLDSTKARIQDGEVFLREQLSLIEDADLAELIAELTTRENTFQAALSASSRVLQPTLMDFLY